ncbi:hypothetical protein N7532_002703 [Penicillium argentinense]|uniref:Uncharacterized protein n=1 Tax=Penicillium argentinense TaxID=1131581 RepID=A0A9W9G156_9EURO|nr:uncharacterized protein N7532_002703 [Penicillium argentinense]KAJ5110058.1 hypothetical protein N7532_002703 [Penicillium argentinense]
MYELANSLVSFSFLCLAQLLMGLASNSDPMMLLLAWSFHSRQMVFLLGSDAACALIVLVVFISEFLWIGIEWTGDIRGIPLGVLLDSILTREANITASAMLQLPLPLDGELQ